MGKRYTVQRKGSGAPDWDYVEPVLIDFFFDKGSDHRPETTARVVYDDDRLFLRFDVADRHVKAVAVNYQDSVCKDSCVEFFVQPKAGGPYFNFEINAGGCMLLYCISVDDDGRALMDEKQEVPAELVQDLNITSTLPPRIEDEITDPCKWTLEYTIPFALFEHYLGEVRPLDGQIWRANFFKCADDTSHPHWGMWSPILDGYRFHRPEYFGELHFGA